MDAWPEHVAFCKANAKWSCLERNAEVFSSYFKMQL